MLAECRRVSRTAARAGDDHLWGPTLEARREFGQGLCQAVLLPPDCLRGLSDLISHPYFDFAHTLPRYECATSKPARQSRIPSPVAPAGRRTCVSWNQSAPRLSTQAT